jgi:hypothetical protein
MQDTEDWMSGKALTWAKKIPFLKAGEQSLLNVIASSFNDKKNCCYPSIKTLAKWCKLTDRTIKRHLKSLISKNIVQKLEDIRNPLGHRVTTKYTLNFDLNLDSLSDNLSCGKVQSLGDNLASLSDNLSMPRCQNDTKDYILNKNINKKRNINFSLVDNFNKQKQQTILGVKFDQLRKINDDHFDIENARKLFFSICLKNKHPIRFAENLIKARDHQINEFEKQTKRGKLMPAPCSLTNWLKGERWNDIIKPLGEKKKVSPYIKCKICGEEYLKGTHCKICARKSETRVTAYA